MQTLTYVLGKDKRAKVKDVTDFKVDFTDDNTNWLQARQYEHGMRQVLVKVGTELNSGEIEPYDLTGCNYMFEGWLPGGKYRVIDAKHGVPVDPLTGQFRFDFPRQAFSIAGSYKQAFFRIFRDGLNVATLEFDLEVLADKVISGLVPADYITPLNDLLDQAMAKFDGTAADLDKLKADYTQRFTDLFNSLSSQGADTAALLTTLETKIKQDGLLTVGEFTDLFTVALNKSDWAIEESNARHSDMLNKDFDTLKARGDFWDDEFGGKYINAKWYGAVGDGVTDDTDVIQEMLDKAFAEKGVLTVYLPAGKYLITRPLIMKATNDHSDFYLGHGVHLVGHDKADTFIIKQGGKLDDANNDAVLTMIGIVKETGINAKSGTGIRVENLSLENQSTNSDSYAIIGRAFQRGVLKDLNIKGINGVHMIDPYVSQYLGIVLTTQTSGIWLEGGTSNYLQSCFGQTGANPFKISSYYSVLDNCFAEDVTGTVFDFPEAYGISMNGCGDEASRAQYKIAVSKGLIEINGYFSNFPAGNADDYTTAESAIMHITGDVVATLLGLQIGFTSTYAIKQDAYLLWLDSAGINANISVGDIRYSTSNGWGGTPGGNVHRLIYSNIATSLTDQGHIQSKGVDVLTRRNRLQPYLGMRDLKDTMSNSFYQKGIYLDNVDDMHTSDADVSSEPGYHMGDVLLYNNPAGRAMLGAVATNDADTVKQNTFAHIPLVQGGPSSNRPKITLNQIGIMYFDTTLNKAIWWNGSGWVDFEGTAS